MAAPVSYYQNTKLLTALNEIAVCLHQSATAEQDILCALQDKLGETGFLGALSLRARDNRSLSLRVLAMPPGSQPDFKRILGGSLDGGYTYSFDKLVHIRKVVTTQQPVFMAHSREYLAQILPANLRLYQDEILAAYGDKPQILSPLMLAGEMVGVIGLVGEDLTAGDIPLVETFAEHVASALRNAQLMATERQRRQEAEMLNQAAAALTSSLDRDQVLEAILTHLDQVIPYDSAAIFLIEKDLLLEALNTTRKPLILADAQQDPRFQGWGGVADVHGWMGVPLIARGDVIGYLTLDNQQAGVYTPAHARLVTAFANQAAMMIENTRLFESERAQLLLANTLKEVGALLTSRSGLDEVLEKMEKILDLLGRVVKYDSVSIQLLSPAGQLELAAGRGFPDIERASQIVQQLSAYLLDAKWTRKTVNVIPDTSQDESWVVLPGAEYIRSWIGAPLLVRGRFIGSLNVDSRLVNAYDEKTAETVMAFANQAAIAIENARLFEAERQARERSEALRHAASIVGTLLSQDQIFTACLLIVAM